MSRIAPYVPMKPAQKPVTTTDMWKTLAKHAQPKVDIQVSPEVQSPQAKTGLKLEWASPTWHLRDHSAASLFSTCGRYRIDKVRGEYTSWRCAKGLTELNRKLGVADSAEGAKILCEEDGL